MSDEDNDVGSVLFTTQGIQVTMIDKCMSGWGAAKDKTNYFVVECDTEEQAQLIEHNAKLRSEMNNIRIINHRKVWPANVHVSLKHFNELGSIWKRPEVSDDD
jgi:hypothetical protein